jgi:erythromycin esterase-like protein
MSTPFETLHAYISQHAIPFSPEDPASLATLSDRLLAACDPHLQILALGEPTHLVNDYLLLRNRFFQTLAQRHHFSAIAIESSFTRSHLANDFILGGPTSLDDALAQGITHNMHHLPAQRELLQWMRDYNTSHPTPLHFYGFDSPTEMTHADSPRSLLTTTLDYLATLDPPAAQNYRQQIDPLIAPDNDWQNPAAMMDPAHSIGRSPNANALRLATEDLLTHLTTLEPQAPDPRAFRHALRHATLARQLLTYHAAMASTSPTHFADLLALRDRIMADNLLHLAAHEQPRGKLLAFAHNTHLQRTQATWTWGPQKLTWYPAGAHLAAALRTQYATITTAAATSTTNHLPPPTPETLESLLTISPAPAHLLPTQNAPTLPPGTVPTRPTDPRYSPLTQSSLTNANFLLLLKTAD